MGMFGGTHKETPKNQDIDKISNASTNIGKGAILHGNIDTLGNVRVDGKLYGDIRSKSKVATGNASLIEGSITAQNAEIEGEVRGSLEIAELLILKSTAVINGDIITSKLVVEAGAIFNGKCQMGDINQIKKMLQEDKENAKADSSNNKDELNPNSVFSDLKI